MSELRQDPIVGRWVIIAPERALRPNAAETQPVFRADADDPFAEGRESETTGEVLAIRNPGTAPDSPGWRVRVFPNKYPAVRLNVDGATNDEPFSRSAPALGPHEVIVEAPHFETCLSRLPMEHVRDVFWVYRERLRHHRAERTCHHALIFKNKGVAGGATLAHVHAQLIGTLWTPVAIEEELTASRRHLEQTGSCIFDDLLQRELAAKVRIVLETDRFVVLCPFASRVSGETWIIPRFEADRFEDVGDSDLKETADLLHSALRRLNAVMPDLPYNYFIHSAPFVTDNAAFYRWHIEILPRVGTTAGFEWGGGCYVNTTPPEEAAAALRAAVART